MCVCVLQKIVKLVEVVFSIVDNYAILCYSGMENTELEEDNERTETRGPIHNDHSEAH